MGMLWESARVAMAGSGPPRCHAPAPEAQWGVEQM